MDNEAFHEKYRKLPIVALVTGIIGVSFVVFYNLLWVFIGDFLQKFIADVGFIPYLIISFFCICISLTITAVITGSIDLKRIKTGKYNKRGKGFDITGIILGSFLILSILIFGFLEFYSLIDLI